MELGLFRGLLTVVLLALFVGLWVWAWSRNRRGDFDAASQLPLADDEYPPDHSNRGNGHE